MNPRLRGLLFPWTHRDPLDKISGFVTYALWIGVIVLVVWPAWSKAAAVLLLLCAITMAIITLIMFQQTKASLRKVQAPNHALMLYVGDITEDELTLDERAAVAEHMAEVARTVADQSTKD